MRNKLMGKNEYLKAKIRSNVHNYILKYPGLHIRELSRKLGLPKSTLIYHLRYLKKYGFLEEKIDKFYVRYYASGNIDRSYKKILDLFRQETSRRVILYLALNKFASIGEISEHLDKHRSTVSYHLNKLANVGILECYKIDGEKRYMLFDKTGSGRLFFLVLTYENSFMDEETISVIKKAKNNMETKGYDQLLEALREVFPHPYCV
jgi:predicted transcriptional regulator